MKILYTASTAGHLKSFHLPYLSALTARGHAVTAAAAGEGGALPEGVRYVPVPFTKHIAAPQNLAAAAQLTGLMRRERFDLVLSHTSLAGFFTRLAVADCSSRPYVIHTVHGYLFTMDSPFHRRAAMLSAERLAAGVTDTLLVMNAEDLAIARRYQLCLGKAHLIDGMGVPPGRFHIPAPAERSEARRALGIPQEAFVLLCAAEFSHRKNQLELLRAMRSLPGDTVLLLPGAGGTLPDCRALARRYGLADRVMFPGFVRDLSPFRKAADLCVSASRAEGLPFHVIEAMGCAVPCVLSRVKGHTDLLRGGGGLLYPPGSADELARSILRLRADEALRITQGALARRRAQNYTLDAVMERNLSLYSPENLDT